MATCYSVVWMDYTCVYMCVFSHIHICCIDFFLFFL